VLQIFPLSGHLVEGALAHVLVVALGFVARRAHGVTVNIATRVAGFSAAVTKVGVKYLGLVVCFETFAELGHAALDGEVVELVRLLETIEEFEFGSLFLFGELFDVQSA
jgi:hypothetical protein